MFLAIELLNKEMIRGLWRVACWSACHFLCKFKNKIMQILFWVTTVPLCWNCIFHFWLGKRYLAQSKSNLWSRVMFHPLWIPHTSSLPCWEALGGKMAAAWWQGRLYLQLPEKKKLWRSASPWESHLNIPGLIFQLGYEFLEDFSLVYQKSESYIT